MKAIKHHLNPSTCFLSLCFSKWHFICSDCVCQITAKEVDEPAKFNQIREGDTLGGLAKEYRSDSRLWCDFEKYNIFANPNLIYPHGPQVWPVKPQA